MLTLCLLNLPVWRKGYVILMPVRSLMELFNVDAHYGKKLLKAIKELKEGRREKPNLSYLNFAGELMQRLEPL